MLSLTRGPTLVSSLQRDKDSHCQCQWLLTSLLKRQDDLKAIKGEGTE